MPDKILIVDDEPFNLDLLEQELADRGYAIERARDGAEALRKMESAAPDLVLLDYMMPGMNGLDVLQGIRDGERDVPVVMITAHGSIEVAVQAMKLGAYDFVLKPFEPDHIALTIQRALDHGRLKRGAAIIAEEQDERYRLIAGKSALMNQAIEVARKASASRATVLLLGESGSGKEVFARAIHNWSERRQEPFIAINCVGLSRELLESELFGHEKGAFTGAHRLKQGKMELAHRGSVLLDEAGDITQELQTKLLRFLQERTFERVGGTKPISVDVRIIAATNRDLDGAVKEGRFREDLYHRLNVIPITVPPLRERREDIPDLARYFVERFSRETKKRVTAISPEVMDRLIAYAWPGNVRELANVIERAIVLGYGTTITPRDLPARVGASTDQASDGGSYQAAVNAYRRELVLNALARTGGNRAAAATVLGIHRTHLMRLLKILRIE
ncbi:MAG TPA: sigma-54 dependent transcriptional regulator [Methylomirabilota bacterium]|jgi:DNA-binding NtrC family response regulator|nr:sigma-54 dependent transcriptional regulator [Methylomirabilota bacterium]